MAKLQQIFDWLGLNDLQGLLGYISWYRVGVGGFLLFLGTFLPPLFRGKDSRRRRGFSGFLIGACKLGCLAAGTILIISAVLTASRREKDLLYELERKIASAQVKELVKPAIVTLVQHELLDELRGNRARSVTEISEEEIIDRSIKYQRYYEILIENPALLLELFKERTPNAEKADEREMSRRAIK